MGTFTLDAKKAARRDGVPPIELVDGETLVEMFEKYELGLIPNGRTTLTRGSSKNTRIEFHQETLRGTESILS
jgi:hypothetical protein